MKAPGPISSNSHILDAAFQNVLESANSSCEWWLAGVHETALASPTVSVVQRQQVCIRGALQFVVEGIDGQVASSGGVLWLWTGYGALELHACTRHESIHRVQESNLCDTHGGVQDDIHASGAQVHAETCREEEQETQTHA
jgi:hypothetical protein